MNNERKSREDKSDRKPKNGFKGASKSKSAKSNSFEGRKNTGGKLQSEDSRSTRSRSNLKESAYQDKRTSVQNSDFESKGRRKPSDKRTEYDKPFDKRSEKKTFSKRDESESGRKSTKGRPDENRTERKTYGKREGKFDNRKSDRVRSEEKPIDKRISSDTAESKKVNRRQSDSGDSKRSFDRKSSYDKPYTKNYSPRKEFKDSKNSEKQHASTGNIRLNKFIANAGICSRRKADDLIKAGTVRVNDEVINELGYLVKPGDKIRYNGELLKREKNVYILLNKPKNIITTTNDPQERKTIMGLIANATSERVYPVGRLDRNTTGLILLTNDGNLAEKLSHPRNKIQKIYDISLDKVLKKEDMDKIRKGLVLEDGPIQVEEIAYVEGGTKKDVGVVIQSGKNRIIRRIFEHLGYEVQKLDRVLFGPLTKKDLPRGKWRYLSDQEIIQLKHFVR